MAEENDSRGDNVLLFRDPAAAREGVASFSARRAYRVRCNKLAQKVVAETFTRAGKDASIGIDEALPIVVAAMRRELRKAWPGL